MSYPGYVTEVSVLNFIHTEFEVANTGAGRYQPQDLDINGAVAVEPLRI